MANLVGQGPAVAGGQTSDVFTTPFPHNPGEFFRDKDGNGYVFVDYTGTVYSNQPVLISSTNTAEAVGTTGRGRLGISVAGGTSDNGGWVQVYGRARLLIGNSGVSVSENPPTSVQTSLSQVFVLPSSATSPAGLGYVTAPSLARERFVVANLFVATDATLADVSDEITSSTSASAAGSSGSIGVWMNFPTVSYEWRTS